VTRAEEMTETPLSVLLLEDDEGQAILTREALEKVRREIPGSPEVQRLADFIENSKRGICR